VAGLADLLRERGLTVFGPGREAARLEGSKVFAKDVMASAGVPTGEARAFTDFAAAAVSPRGDAAVLVAAKVMAVAICADDPGIFGITLSDKVDNVSRWFGLSQEALLDRLGDPGRFRLAKGRG